MVRPFPAAGNWLSTKGQAGSYPPDRAFQAPGRLSHGWKPAHTQVVYDWEDRETNQRPQRDEQPEAGGLG